MFTRIGVPIFGAVALLLAIFSIARTRPVEAAANPPVPPPVAAYARQVGAVGLVEAKSENISISLPVSGLVTRVMVKAGDNVRRGQVLFALDDRDLRAELALRQSAVAVSQARLEKLRSSPRPEEIPPAEARVHEAEQQLADAAVQQKLIEGVTDKRAIRDEDLQRRRLAVKSSQARLEEAQANLRLLRAGTWAPDIKVAEAELAQAQEQVNRTKADLDRLIVTSPIDGQILQCKVRPGEYAQAGPLATPLMLLGVVDVLHVRADIDEEDAWRVKAGSAATGALRGNGAAKYPLHFVRFEPYVIPKKNLTGDSTERVDTRVLQAIFALDKGAPAYVGQQMDVFIESKEGN